MAEVITRKWKNGELVEEKTEQADWQPNAADLDLVTIGCECGNNFQMPWDAVAFGGLGEGSFCGQCGSSGKMNVIDDPEESKPKSDCIHSFKQYFGPVYSCEQCGEQRIRDITKPGIVWR